VAIARPKRNCHFLFFLFCDKILIEFNLILQTMKKNIIKTIIVIIIFSVFILSSPAVYAGTVKTTTGGTVSLTNPLTGNETPTTIPTLIGYLIKAIMGIVGSLALVMIIYGGFVWMTAAGNTEKITQGKNILVWAIIGLVVIFSAYLLVSNIINISTGKGLLSGTAPQTETFDPENRAE